MEQKQYDLIIVGGGIIGAAIARESAARGLFVCLVEAKDLACATSSGSSGIAHGGLRYVPQFHVDLLLESLRERDALFRNAPHLVTPIDWAIPIKDGNLVVMVKAWLATFGYDVLARSDNVPKSRFANKENEVQFFEGILDTVNKVRLYGDGVLNGAGLTVENAQAAAEDGADIFTYTKVENLQKSANGNWILDVAGQKTGERTQISSRMFVNATGPWAVKFAEECGLRTEGMPGLVFSKGSHLLVPKVHEHPHAYSCLLPGNNIFFMIPHSENFTLLGTTNRDFSADPYTAGISQDEVEEILEKANRFLKVGISERDIVHSWAAVRAMASKSPNPKNLAVVSRAHEIFDHGDMAWSVFGGKLTGHRVIAEQVVDKILQKSSNLNCLQALWRKAKEGRRSKTFSMSLPGGDLGGLSLSEFTQKKQDEYGWLDDKVIARYVKTYGSRIDALLGVFRCVNQMGLDYGSGVYQAEIDYLIVHQFMTTYQDYYRRTRMNLFASDETKKVLEETYPALEAIA